MNDALMKNFEEMVVKDKVAVIHSDYRDGVAPTTVAFVSVGNTVPEVPTTALTDVPELLVPVRVSPSEKEFEELLEPVLVYETNNVAAEVVVASCVSITLPTTPEVPPVITSPAVNVPD